MAGFLIVILIFADIAGVVMSFILDVLFSLPVRGAGTSAFYAVWFVAGVFAGMLGYMYAGGVAYPRVKVDWTSVEGASATGRLVCTVVVILVAVLAYPLYLISGDASDDYFVPDNGPLTVVFLVAFVGATFFAHYLQPRSAPKRT